MTIDLCVQADYMVDEAEDQTSDRFLEVYLLWRTPVSHLPYELTREELTRQQTQRWSHLPTTEQQDQPSAPLLQPHSPEPFYYEPLFSASRAGSVSGSNSPYLRCLLGRRCQEGDGKFFPFLRSL